MPRINRLAMEDSEEDSDNNQQQLSQRNRGPSSGTSQSKSQNMSSSRGNVNDDDIEKMVSDVVFYFLVGSQGGRVVKRADMCKQCDLSGKARADQDLVIEKAKLHLATVFGIKVVEREQQRGQYFLVNQLVGQSEEDSEYLHYTDIECGQMGLTFSILGLVFMNGGKVTDDVLFKFLKNMGVYDEEGSGKRERGRERGVGAVDPEVLSLFGDVKKFVNEILVGRQHYLNRTKVPQQDVEQECYEYSWGERAELEVKRSSVLRMVCQVYDDCSPKMFKEQFDKVKELEGDDAMEDNEEDE